jgi:glucose dehydrogenase
MNLLPDRRLCVATAGCLLLIQAAAAAESDLERMMANPQDWAAQAGDYSNQRWSDLKQINSSNVGKLQVAWTMSTGVLRGHEGLPGARDRTRICWWIRPKP